MVLVSIFLRGARPLQVNGAECLNMSLVDCRKKIKKGSVDFFWLHLFYALAGVFLSSIPFLQFLIKVLIYSGASSIKCKTSNSFRLDFGLCNRRCVVIFPNYLYLRRSLKREPQIFGGTSKW